MPRDLGLRLELMITFVIAPLVIGVWVTPGWWIPVLWALAVAAWLALLWQKKVRPSGFWSPIDWKGGRLERRRILTRFLVLSLGLVGFVALHSPERLFSFPREEPLVWAAVMVLYPLLSVYPQELLYRRYFFHRYERLFVSDTWLVLGSAVLFGWMHLLFRNWVALAATMIGGWIFADTYRRTGSLRLTCVEHALYGNVIFTIGLGDYFYHGGVKQ